MDNDGLANFLEVMKDAYTKEELCDVEIQAAGRNFKASKHMLSVHSPVFRAMFTNDTLEKKSNVVQINEFDVELIGSFLSYLHTGNHPNTNTLALMFPIADYYDVAKLKAACLKALHSTLDTVNAPEYYELAEKFKLDDLKNEALKRMETNLNLGTFYLYFEFASKHEYTELKPKVLQFMSDNLLEVASTKDWNNLDPQLRLELFQSQVKNLRSQMMPTDKELQLSVQLCEKSNTTYTNGTEAFNCYTRKIYLKNEGSKSLVYKIVPCAPDPAFHVSPSKTNIIYRNKKDSVKIQFTNPKVIVLYKRLNPLIDYKFKDKDFCRLKILEL